MGLKDRLAVVSGVTSGIGRALVTRLLDEGCRVFGIARDRDRLGEAAHAWGAPFVGVRADLASPADRARCCDEICARFDRIDVLVNNAAQCVYETPLALTMDAWRDLFEVNLMAVIELTRAIVPRMGREGHVVSMSSVTGRFVPNERFSPYALTKAAIDQWHQGLRLELEPKGIKTTLVVPGLVDTPIYDKVAGFEKTRAKIKEQIPTWLTPEDVADAIVWTLSRPAHVVVGEIVLLPRGQAR
jgi:NAD(P)-dependent dehydrogenase (short-subunit alcohol dehydrogenase family)